MTIRRHRALITLLGVLFITGACGGSDSSGDNGGLPTGGGDGDSEIVVGGDLEVPDYFPSDFYFPDGVKITSVSNLPETNMIALGASFEGEADAVRADMRDGLVAAGYELINEDEDFTVFIKNGVGRIRIRARDFLGQPTLTVDIDTWTDEQLDELRVLSAEEIVTTGRATATVGGETIEAEGECRIMGDSRSFLAADVSITLQFNAQPTGLITYADVTTPDGRVFTIDQSIDPQITNSDGTLAASGEMTEFTSEAIERFDFTIEATCDS